MLAYIIRRLLLIIPTLFGIMVINFIIVQFAPGGPVEQMIAELEGTAVHATARFSGGGGGDIQGAQNTASQNNDIANKYRGAQGLRPEIIEAIEKQFGFDKPAHERFINMLWNYMRFDFGESYFRDQKVIDLI